MFALLLGLGLVDAADRPHQQRARPARWWSLAGAEQDRQQGAGQGVDEGKVVQGQIQPAVPSSLQVRRGGGTLSTLRATQPAHTHLLVILEATWPSQLGRTAPFPAQPCCSRRSQRSHPAGGPAVAVAEDG